MRHIFYVKYVIRLFVQIVIQRIIIHIVKIIHDLIDNGFKGVDIHHAHMSMTTLSKIGIRLVAENAAIITD